MNQQHLELVEDRLGGGAGGVGLAAVVVDAACAPPEPRSDHSILAARMRILNSMRVPFFLKEPPLTFLHAGN